MSEENNLEQKEVYVKEVYKDAITLMFFDEEGNFKTNIDKSCVLICIDNNEKINYISEYTDNNEKNIRKGKLFILDVVDDVIFMSYGIGEVFGYSNTKAIDMIFSVIIESLSNGEIRFEEFFKQVGMLEYIEQAMNMLDRLELDINKVKELYKYSKELIEQASKNRLHFVNIAGEIYTTYELIEEITQSYINNYRKTDFDKFFSKIDEYYNIEEDKKIKLNEKYANKLKQLFN